MNRFERDVLILIMIAMFAFSGLGKVLGMGGWFKGERLTIASSLQRK